MAASTLGDKEQSHGSHNDMYPGGDSSAPGGIHQEGIGSSRSPHEGRTIEASSSGNHQSIGPSHLRDAEENGAGSSHVNHRLKDLAAGGLVAGLGAGGGKGLEKSGILNNLENGGGNNNNSPFSYTGGESGGGGLGRARTFLEKHRKKVIAGSLIGVGILPLIALLLFLLAALKIPHFVENMAAWRFAKLTRQYRATVKNVIGQKAALDSLSDEDKQKAKGKYGKYPSFDKVNRLRPNRVMQSLQTSDRLQYNYKKTPWGNQKLVSVTVAPDADPAKKVTINVPTGKFDRALHPFRTMDQYRQLSEAVNSAMKAHDPKIPTVVRAAVTKRLVTKIGGSLKGLVASRYIGKSDRDAKIAIQQESYERTKDRGGISGVGSDDLKKVMNDVAAEEDKCVQDPKCLGKSVDAGGGTPEEVDRVLANGTDPGKMSAVAKKIVGWANPIYDIAVPICMVYDGSKISSASIDAQGVAVQRESLLVLSTADQQKNGNGYGTGAAGAMNWKLGNVQDSHAIRRVSGKPVDTTAGLGGQRTLLGTYGQYTIFDVMMGPGNHPFNDVADELCPTVTNIWVGVSLGVVNLGIMAVTAVFSGGTATAGQLTAQASVRTAATTAIRAKASQIVRDFTVKKAIGKTFRVGKQYTKDIVKWGAATAAATLLARAIVMNAAGSFNNGLETGAQFANNVDDGANQFSNGTMRINYAGRPLTNAEVVADHKADRAEIARYNESLSTFDRYLALENPNSLMARTIITTGSLLERDTIASLMNSIASIFNPVGLTSKVFASANGQAAMAAGNFNTEDYGNVQFGYSLEEKRLMETVDSYRVPLENEHILKESGKFEEVESKYDKCFNPETKSVGQLLEDGDITRNEEGDILNEGDCRPAETGHKNPDYGDLVFRYRLYKSYDNTTDLTLGIQDPSDPGVGTATSDPSNANQQLRWPYKDDVNTNITSCFGPRSSGFHEGLDISTGGSADIVAAGAGTVVKAGSGAGYGPHFVVIEHDNGLGTSYGHMSSKTVSVGDRVTQGQVIGHEGSLGRSTGPHLHFNVFPGKYAGNQNANVNPLSKTKAPAGTSNPKGCR